MSAPEDFCHNCIVAGYKKFKTVCGHQRYCLECRSSVTKPIRRPRSSGRPSILLDNSVLCKVCSELVELVDDDPKKPNRDPPQPLVICGRDFR